MNTTVLKLENCKNYLRRTYDKYMDNRSNNFDFNIYLSNEEYKESRLIIMEICKDKGLEVPKIFKDCRTVEEFILFIVSDYNAHYLENMLYISDQFNEFIDLVEMESVEVQIIHVKTDFPKELNYKHILEDVEKCDHRIDIGDYSGALTSARSLIEGVFKEIILKIQGKEIEGKPPLTELFKEVRYLLNLDPSNKDLQKPLREVISGLIKVVHGLNEIRNISGDMHARKISPSLHHALLVVNSAKTVANFLFHTYEYQRKLGKINISI